jgi:HD-like signal output (HDOD) protein
MTVAAPDSVRTTIDEIVRRAGALYSLPAVAVEVLKLTEHPRVDVHALKQCIERDPALTAKILRVVNSSVFGLPREVRDLNQALALLGIKPLKLLALGFSLPESLFLAAGREQLAWYWKNALVRAVAAREISEQLFQRPGDDAFLAGLLQDLGVLALLGEIGLPYARLVSEAIAARAELCRLEMESLGFDHMQLTAGLLEHWNLPTALSAAIAEPRDVRRWARSKADHAHLVRVLHLAELFAQLIGQRRLSVLPDLLEAGAAYGELDKPRLNELVAALEPKVRQLAGVLSLSIAEKGGYLQIVAQAHQRMAALAESVAGTLSQGLAAEAAHPIECEMQELHALAVARQLRASFAAFFSEPRGELAAAAPSNRRARCEGTDPDEESRPARAPRESVCRDDLATRLTVAVGRCRSLRRPLAVVLISAEPSAALADAQALTLERAMEAIAAYAAEDGDRVTLAGGTRQLIMLSDGERMQAVATARLVVEELRMRLSPMQCAGLLPPCALAAGVAWVAAPAKNFRPMSLVETAERCLAAARAGGGVKSLEVS